MAVPQRDSVSGVISRFLARRARCAAYALAAALFVLASSVADPALAAPRYGHAAIVERDGATVFERDGRPFFLYGAAFFYERLPRASWDASMDALARIGINTLDLYVPWNWHELSDGDFDFDGRTNPRRDLHEVLRLAAAHDFAIVLRPGPVVRNEWRNGGYPAWLLERPEYAMPRHDLLEGRYPPIATLQNAHSDDAARAWMANATHTYYARRWLERVLRECAPVADRILAVALDDDQGAYIDNQTYPAPHLRAYLAWLRGVVHGVTGDDELTFVNTYQMKVPSSSPVWAMGNWYQSEAYALGEHDLAQLELSFGMLATRPHQPLFASEFQAGWLEGAGDARPRAADPANTELALATMLGDGARGIVNFPAQDTLDPPGWEAPFANAFYAWDAALDLAGTPGARYAPTAAFGAFVGRFNAELAAAPVARDAAIAYFGGSFAPARTTNELIGDAAARLEEAQAACRAAGLSCAVVDPRVADLRPFRVLIAPAPHVATVPPLEPVVAARLRAFARGGGLIDAGSPTADGLLADLARARRVPVVLTVHDPRPHTGSDADFVARGLVFRERLRADAAAYHVHGPHCERELRATRQVDRPLISTAHGAMFIPTPDTRRPREPLSLLFFGRMEAYKGLETLLDAADMLRAQGRTFRLIVAGRGPELARLAPRLREPDVELHDRFISHDEAIVLFQRASVVVGPYRDATQSGIVASAFGNGRPVVVSAVGGLPDFVTHGRDGFVVPPDDPAALAAALAPLLADDGLAEALAAGVAAKLRAELGWDTIATRLESFYREVIAAHRATAAHPIEACP